MADARHGMTEGSPRIEADPSASGDSLAPAITLPLFLGALAYGLWLLSDRLGSVGPLDKATFGWSVVIPVWLATPVVAAFTWRSLSDAGRNRAALLVGLVIAVTSTFLLFAAVAYPICDTGPHREPFGWLIPSALVGLAIGGGLGVSALAAAGLAGDGHLWRAVFVGAGTELAMVFLAILVATAFLIGPACQRPQP